MKSGIHPPAPQLRQSSQGRMRMRERQLQPPLERRLAFQSSFKHAINQSNRLQTVSRPTHIRRSDRSVSRTVHFFPIPRPGPRSSQATNFVLNELGHLLLLHLLQKLRVRHRLLTVITGRFLARACSTKEKTLKRIWSAKVRNPRFGLLFQRRSSSRLPELGHQ